MFAWVWLASLNTSQVARYSKMPFLASRDTSDSKNYQFLYFDVTYTYGVSRQTAPNKIKAVNS